MTAFSVDVKLHIEVNLYDREALKPPEYESFRGDCGSYFATKCKFYG